MRDCRGRPALEPLEGRVTPVGFYEGPAPVPIILHLVGPADGTAVVRRQFGPSDSTIAFGGSGRLRPLGSTSVAGSLHRTSGGVRGSLVLSSRTSTLTLSVQGPPVQGSGTDVLSFVITDGKGVAAGTTYSYVRKVGSGLVDLTLITAGRRGSFHLDFRTR